jgi:hypothetical protein
VTPRIAAIFEDDEGDVATATTIIDTTIIDVIVDQEVEAVVAAPEFEPWPIVAGTEHYQVFVDDEDAPWPEFILGYHYDFRQPSRLKTLCSPG